MDVNTNPYQTLIDSGELDALETLCKNLSMNETECLCSGGKAVSGWYPQNNSLQSPGHSGPGCIDTITYGDGQKCLLATICQNKFSDKYQMPTCEDPKGCMYPLWTGSGSGFEQVGKLSCSSWDCVNEADVSTPDRWHRGDDCASFINSWKEYLKKINEQ